VGRYRSIPYTGPSLFPGGGSVQQGLSAAYEFIAMFKLRCAADKRYTLELTKWRTCTMEPNKPGIPRPKRPEEESNRLAGAGMGGAILGASVAGPAGAIIGGLIGLIIGEKTNEEKRKGGK